jgi:hypothetical protein
VRATKLFIQTCEFLHPVLVPDHLLIRESKIKNPEEAGMTIKFADGTNIEVAATGFDDFVKHDLKWAEFVHGRAIVKKLSCKEDSRKLVSASASLGPSVHPCPAGGC